MYNGRLVDLGLWEELREDTLLMKFSISNGRFRFNPDPNSGWLYYKNVYIKPWTRCGPYLIGMVVGYVLFKVRNRDFKLNKVISAVSSIPIFM